MTYTTIDRIVTKIKRDYYIDDVSETDVAEYVGEALEAIGHVKYLEQSISFLRVKNYKAELPNGFQYLNLIAKDNTVNSDEDYKCSVMNTINDVLEENKKVLFKTECGCQEVEVDTDRYLIPIDCEGRPMVNIRYSQHTNSYDLHYEGLNYMAWNKARYKYDLLKPSNNKFININLCENNTSSIYSNCQEEYLIQNGLVIFSFPHGAAIMSYYKQPIDLETGYPLIPDDYSVITGISTYVAMKYASRMWYSGREGWGDKVNKLESDWQWYCKQSQNNAKMFKGYAEHKSFMDSVRNQRRYE